METHIQVATQSQRAVTPTLKQLGDLSPMLIDMAAQHSKLPIDRVRAIATGLCCPTLSLTEYDQKVGTRAIISKVAIDYCGADVSISEGAVKECSALFLSKWAMISIPEIKDAFSMAASQEIKAAEKPINLIAYSGVFTVAIFSEVMNAYAAHRGAILAAMHKAAAEIAEQEKAAAKKEDAANYRAKVIESFSRLKAENTEFDKADKIPLRWFEILLQAGLIEHNGKTFVEAKKATAAFFRNCMQDLKHYPNIEMSETKKSDVYREMKKDNELFPDELLGDAKRLYGRMMVFNSISPYKQK